MKISRLCLEEKCPSRRTGNPCAHEVYGIQQGEETPFGRMADMWKIRCGQCGHERLENIPKRSPKKQVGPRYHEGLGRSFDDSDHERKWAKENGYDPV